MYHLFVCVNQSKLSVCRLCDCSNIVHYFAHIVRMQRTDGETERQMYIVVLLPAMFMFCANTRSTHKSTLTNMYIVVRVFDRSRPFHARTLTQTFQFSHPPPPPKPPKSIANCGIVAVRASSATEYRCDNYNTQCVEYFVNISFELRYIFA